MNSTRRSEDAMVDISREQDTTLYTLNKILHFTSCLQYANITLI